MNYPLSDELLLVRGKTSFFLAGRVKAKFPLCIETFSEEYCEGIAEGDLVVVSAPEGGPVEPAAMLLELVRTYHIPLVVLPGDHPGSKRLPYVVSAGRTILTSCSIRRGTHPEQHLICSSDELAGITLEGTGDGIAITGLSPGIRVTRVAGMPGMLPVS